MTERNDEVPVDTTLWCVNIKGPDDVLPVASRAEAVELASRFNEVMTARFEPPSHPYFPLVWAIPTEWPHDDASHAADLGDFGEYAWLRDPLPTEWKVSSERVSGEKLMELSAFPVLDSPDGTALYCRDAGMSLRDWFAGMVASGMAAHSGTSGVSYGPHDIAGRSYQVADAMLAARNAS